MKKLFVQIVCELPTIQGFAWSLLSGIIGILILAGFFSCIMSMETVSMLLPLIVGANAAISGYMLIERGEQIGHKKTLSATVGMMVAVLSFVSVNFLCFQIAGFFLMTWPQALAATIVGTVGGWSGGLLAVKYRALKEQAPA